MFFSEQDLQLIKNSGRSPEKIATLFDYFISGFPFTHLKRPAIVGDGILRIAEKEKAQLLSEYPKLIQNHSITKFVPASGAASRMFKDLYPILQDDFAEISQITEQFITSLSKFAFYDALKQVLKKDGYDLEKEIKHKNYKLILSYLLNKEGLNYGNLPKALLYFHRYPEQVRTAFEEHLVEVAYYAKQSDKSCHLHFTVSPNYYNDFEDLVHNVVPFYEKKYDIEYHISFSVQDPATDTLVSESDNRPFYDSEGNLLFRPSGHGALIYNLNQLQSDFIFIKNIDNVLREEQLETVVDYKKILISYLIKTQKQLHAYLRLLNEGKKDSKLIDEIIQFANIILNIKNLNQDILFEKLNRPIRVCGMVKNEDEPGGGPFWTINSKGEETLQIVESAQIDMTIAEQKRNFDAATHFNPVDIVCSFKDFKGDFFPLSRFIDDETGFISTKSYEGRTIKTLELPGLWNGAMADWITIFIEVPLETFAPVKTIFDLFSR